MITLAQNTIKIMLSETLKKYQIILASGSPRRQQFFKDLGLTFKISVKSIPENYPNTLKHYDISNYLAELKATPYKNEVNNNSILITSDTIVWHNNKALGKPTDTNDAFNILKSLSNDTHEVITSVCFTTKNDQKTIHDITKVTFKHLTNDEIWYYINNFDPFDKAGAYGIQEWIGKIGVTKIEGSFFNVMGLPTHKVYQCLNELAK